MQYTVISDQYVSLYTHSVGLVLIVPLCGRTALCRRAEAVCGVWLVLYHADYCSVLGNRSHDLKDGAVISVSSIKSL